jgi:hypothetical protein
MIWRGLQLFFVGFFLGAAPLYAFTYGNQPQSFVVSGLLLSQFNGVYHLSSDYDLGDRSEFWYDKDDYTVYGYIEADTAGNLNVWLLSDYFSVAVLTDGSTATLNNGEDEIEQSSGWSITWEGGGHGPGYVPPPEEPTFDWTSAVVNIPFGFAFAMSFWAVAVSLSVAMKWVRELASAAT